MITSLSYDFFNMTICVVCMYILICIIRIVCILPMKPELVQFVVGAVVKGIEHISTHLFVNI